jgi:hypothetical protein
VVQGRENLLAGQVTSRPEQHQRVGPHHDTPGIPAWPPDAVRIAKRTRPAKPIEARFVLTGIFPLLRPRWLDRPW